MHFMKPYKKPRHSKVFLAFLVALTLMGILLVPALPNSIKRPLIASQATQYFIHAYHSLRKLPDIAFFPYWFLKSDLPLYSLLIDEGDLKRLESSLPADPIGGHLGELNRVSVKGTFLAGDYQDRVDIRYRGTNANHWNSLKRSWRINFKHTNLFDGMEGLNLIIPSDRGEVAELLNIYRAQKLGVLSPEMKLIRLKINMRDAGVYLATESWSPSWVERHELPTAGSLFTIDDTDPNFRKLSVFTKEGASLWKSENQKNTDGMVHDEIAALIEIVQNTSDADFQRLAPHIIDLPKLYAWSVVNILANSSHQDDQNNSTLFFNASTGKFEPISWDIGLDTSPAPTAYTESQTLAQRVFSIPEFRDARNTLLKNYTANTQNLTDDIAFYDNLVHLYRSDFFRDNTKLDNNISLIHEMRLYRGAIEANFQNASHTLPKNETSMAPAKAGTLTLPEKFRYVPDLLLGIDAFLAVHPQFHRIDARIIGISGTQAITKTVVIPPNLQLIIRPGTTLLLGEKTNIVSYSPVEAKGTPDAPIIIKELTPGKPFGTVLILDAHGQSIFTWTSLSGGSGGTINGVTSTGMLALHGDNTAEIRHATFADTYDDDALSIKYGKAIISDSLFRNTFSDAIDLDYNDIIIERNTFQAPIGRATDPNLLGDAIDISFSKATIRDNTIYGCSDKGISVGERSRPHIENNTISNCSIGIAVKDQADAVIQGGVLTHNGVGISLYRKKQIFGGSHARITGVIFKDNGEEIKTDEFSSYESTP
ncbi:MAG: hypothetical protein A2756_00425 [Candidatus Ryanbacteria bacterium RIFCSPHIGHO2_01_FULL_48_27]|uniref:Right handed beta helix domain-containing protein n=1 Tax=Candidatus Ryanbacteria bacterium RIFCSPHIGHO2_01_FULL_48_27 TaxID=1802115 RepID=A0A1G2G5E7_9BACT|nr:MAG: hypothetical protein A2756_00425 [Candidatus Ryanbacteria bacterium RIFCSPHIGHO2_01_FULL_48_27]